MREWLLFRLCFLWIKSIRRDYFDYSTHGTRSHSSETRAVDPVMEYDDEGDFLHYREVKKLKDVRDRVHSWKSFRKVKTQSDIKS